MTQSSPIDARSPVAPLVSKLTQQRDHYQQLKQLSAQQATLIAEGDTEQLLGVLARRQQIVDQLAMIGEQMAGDRERWPQLAPEISGEDRSRVESLLAEVESLLEAIIEQDDRDRAQLQTARDSVGSQIKQTHHAGRAMHAYRGAAPASPARFTDSRG